VDQKFIDLVPACLTITTSRKTPDTMLPGGTYTADRSVASRVLGCAMMGRSTSSTSSSYHPQEPNALSRHANRYQLSDRPDLQPLFAEYRARLIENGYEQPHYGRILMTSSTPGNRYPANSRFFTEVDPRNGPEIGDPFRSKIMKHRAAMMKKLTRTLRTAAYSRLLTGRAYPFASLQTLAGRGTNFQIMSDAVALPVRGK